MFILFSSLINHLLSSVIAVALKKTILLLFDSGLQTTSSCNFADCKLILVAFPIRVNQHFNVFIQTGACKFYLRLHKQYLRFGPKFHR